MFTLDQLRGFVAVAEELHFGRAAERLSMTQPPLSRQIQKLERTVGAQLLERDKRRVTLTAAGVAFLHEARRLLTLAAQAPQTARRISEGSTGTVRIGFTAASTNSALVDVLDTMTAALPGVAVDLAEMVTREQLGALDREEIDLGLARPPFDPELYSSHPLVREDLIVAVHADHRLARRGRAVTLDEIAAEPLIVHSPTQARYFSDLVVRHIPIDHARVQHTVSQILTMLWLVAGRRGIAFVPESARRLNIDDVRFLPIEGLPSDLVELHLLWRSDHQNPALRRAIHVLTRADATGASFDP